MTDQHSSVTRKSLGMFGILGGFVCEAAAVLPFVAPEVIWVHASQSVWLHLSAAILLGCGASALLNARGIAQWIGASFLFALLGFVLPVLGLFAVLGM